MQCQSTGVQKSTTLPQKRQSLPTITGALHQTSYKQTPQEKFPLFSILVSDYICVGFTCFLPTLESTSPLPSKYQSLPTLTDALDQTFYKERSRDPGRSQTAMAFPPFMILVSDQICVGLTGSSIASFFSCWCQCLLHYHGLMHRS